MKACSLTFIVAIILSARVFGQGSDFERVDFKKADSIAELYPNHSLDNLKVLADKLTTPLPTDVLKFRAIYKWVCINIDGDYAMNEENQRKRQKLANNPTELKAWNIKFSKRVYSKLLEEKSTVCTGYAYLVKELAYFAGISVVIIDGYGRTVQSNIGGSGSVNHSWNAVQLNNKWYLCDPTWSAGAYHTATSMYVRKFEGSYFLANPALFVRNHYPTDASWMLFDERPTLSEFLNGPLIYVDAFRYEVQPLLPKTFEITSGKGENISFQFTTDKSDAISKAELRIERPGSTGGVKVPASPDKTGLYAIDHKFSAKGTYIVHFLLNNNNAYTYNVTVK